MPALVLMIICVVISLAVILVYNLTYVDNTGVMTDALKDGCLEIYNDKEAEFEVLAETDENGEKKIITFDGIEQVITCKEKNLCVFEIKADGYSKNGLHILVGINSDGEVEGISFIEITDTKGVGTKVENEDWLENFKGLKDKNDADGVDSITGATYSSKGVKGAVKTALGAYSEHKEEIFG